METVGAERLKKNLTESNKKNKFDVTATLEKAT